MEMLIALLLFLFPLAYSPGPGNIFFAATGARYGLRATLPANFGYHFATIILAGAVGLGFAAAMEQFPRLFDLIRVLGAAYVLYLAMTFLRAQSSDAALDGVPVGFVGGAALLVLNPKAYVIMTLMYSQFLPASADWTDVVWIAVIFTLNNFVAFLIWTILGERIALHFRDGRSARVLNICFGVTLASVAIWMLLG
ncbi:Threonine/homoserine/homoserine lactone efflux protein [Sulfitobacter marinus]|uniref:Threonine/homoserine/homoserine lactone efflux protein n=1 Tax=Sulfitobacter marinus TaxID=394264 RepID=A0A1I6TAW3_9RHOB|nr:LysE family translocator [Sulfitobacter marinus]SFS86352.1 Threonine/homoserine/homoserine lactone efflux protein [Sulfitobacter marinus]